MSTFNPHAEVRARLEAVEKLTDPDELVRVACTDESPRVRLGAISRVDDDDRLVRVVKEAQELDVRLVAVERISAQQVIADLLKDPKNLALVGMCFSRISDRDLIESIAENPGYPPLVRRLAVEHYADESYLAEAAAEGGRKSDAAVAAFVRAYGGGLRGVHAIGRFRRSEKALRALGTIASQGGETGELAVEYLCGALGSANPNLSRVARDELSALEDPSLVACLVRAMVDPKLSGPVREVLAKIGTAAARAALGDT